MLTQRLDELSRPPLLYSDFDFESLIRQTKYEIFARSMPEPLMRSDVNLWKSLIGKIETFKGDYSQLFFMFHYFPAYEYDEQIGDLFIVQDKEKIAVPPEKQNAVHERLQKEINGYIDLVENALGFLAPAMIQDLKAEIAAVEHHRTFEYTHIKSLPQNIKALHRHLIDAHFIHPETSSSDFTAIFSGKAVALPPIKWVGSSYRLCEDMIRWLVANGVLRKMQRGEEWVIGNTCFTYPARASAKLGRQKATGSPDYLVLKQITFELINATPSLKKRL